MTDVRKVGAVIPISQELYDEWRPEGAAMSPLSRLVHEALLDMTVGPRYGPAFPAWPRRKPRIVVRWKGRNEEDYE